MTPIGPSHWNYKNGMRGRYMPARLAAKYAESLADPHLTEYRQDLATLEARLNELLESGESSLLWSLTQKAFFEMRDAMAERDGGKTAAALSSLDSLINRGMADALRWTEIYRIMEQSGKTKEREHKRLVQTEQMHSTEQLLAMLGQIANAARESIRSKEDLDAFSAALNKFGTVIPRESAESGH